VYEGDQDDGNTVRVSAGRLQRSGVKTELVGTQPISQIIKAPGVVAFDETKLSVVAMRFDGFIDKVMQVTSGTHVRKGEPLMSVFGQELLNASVQLIVEEVTGWKGPERDEATSSSAPRDPRARVVGARRRLQNLQVPAEVIDEIKKSRRVPDAITWLAPQDGIVTERNAVDGQAFKAGEVLFRLADHSVVWVMADIAEGDIGAVRPGRRRRLSAPGERDAHGARSHRAAQSRRGAASRYVRRCRDCHGLRPSRGGGAEELGHRQWQSAGGDRRSGRRPVRAA
jgi:Cu(I)/Ag(I) efflux system membrane fusion protein